MQTVVALLVGGVAAAVGLLILRRQPTHPVGWLLLAQGVTFALLVGSPNESGNDDHLVADQLLSGAWVFLFLWLVLIAYLLPDGRTPSTFWRRWVQVGLLGVVAFLLGAAGDREGFREAHRGAEPPLPWLPEPVSLVLGGVGLALVVLLIFGSVAAVRWRLRRATGDVRLQLLWLVWGALSVPAALAFGWVNHFLLGDRPAAFLLALGVAGVTLPVTIGIAVLRHRLFDIELVLSRTLTYATLSALVIGVYAATLTLAERVVDNRSTSGLLAVGLVAIVLHPAYAFLHRRVDRLVYGYRSTPHEAIRLLADRAEAADPDGLIDAVTLTVAAALKVDRVWVETGETTQGDVLRSPLVHRGVHVGDLAIEVPPGRTMSAADLALVRDLVRYTTLLVRAEQLNDDLRDSRSRLVAGREEERRRLRRDLHDGVGPSLAALVLMLDAVQSRGNETERNALVSETRTEVQSVIAEIRRLVDDLRPPAIDEVGLVGAIRQRAAGLTSADLTFVVTGPDLVTLPAAVEVAAFRIATEAMTNAVRHSRASRCTVDLSLDESLVVAVRDNGRGAGPEITRGVGWSSMTERAAELGGSCSISDRAEGGVLVRAVLPLGHSAHVESLT